MNGKLVKTCPLYDNDSTYNVNNMSPVTLTPNGGFSGILLNLIIITMTITSRYLEYL